MKITLRSDDDAATRAQKLRALCGLTEGDPLVLARQQADIAEVIAIYAEIDGRAYDGALDSFRSYEAAIAAIRKQKHGG